MIVNGAPRSDRWLSGIERELRVPSKQPETKQKSECYSTVNAFYDLQTLDEHGNGLLSPQVTKSRSLFQYRGTKVGDWMYSLDVAYQSSSIVV